MGTIQIKKLILKILQHKFIIDGVISIFNTWCFCCVLGQKNDFQKVAAVYVDTNNENRLLFFCRLIYTINFSLHSHR